LRHYATQSLALSGKSALQRLPWPTLRGSHGKSFSHANKKRRNPGYQNRGNRILIVGSLRELALYRAEVLHHAGFIVEVPDTIADAIRSIEKGGVDAVVLSYTLPNETVQQLADATRQYCPSGRIITITDVQVPDRRITPDAVAIASEGPASLIAALKRVLPHR